MKDVFGITGKGQIPALDGLRAVSILAVIGFHAGWKGFSGGGRGVDLFYVISGFLISWLLLKEKEKYGSVSLKNFYYRRMLRILPAFYVFLAGYWLICQYVFVDFKSRVSESLIIAGTYSTNFMIGWFNRDVLVAHTWSLSLEEQFYLFFPLIVAFLPRIQATVFSVFLVVAMPLWRTVLYLWSEPGAMPYRFAYSPDTRFDTIVWGCLLALLLANDRINSIVINKLGKMITLTIGLILLSVSVYISNGSRLFMSTAGYTLTAVSFTIVVGFCISRDDHIITELMSMWPMQIIGRLSYALYLWHPAALGVANKVSKHFGGPISDVVTVTIYLCLTFGCALASYLLIEQPFLKLKDKYTVVRATMG